MASTNFNYEFYPPSCFLGTATSLKTQQSWSCSMPSQSQIPANWPPDLVYLETPVYAPSVPEHALRQLASTPCSPVISISKSQGHSSTRILPIQLPNHPAYGQRGLFASKSLQPGDFVCFYMGYVHTSSETDKQSDYDLSLDRELDISIDALNMGNEARFANDYRGISSHPNAEFKDCYVEVPGKRGQKLVERRIGFFVLSEQRPKSVQGPKKGGKRGIQKGEEILVSYGKGFWRERLRDQG